MQHGHKTVVLVAVYHLQPDVSGVRNTGDGRRRTRKNGNAVPFRLELAGPGKS